MSKLDKIRSIKSNLENGLFSGQGVATPTQAEITNAIVRLAKKHPEYIYEGKSLRDKLDKSTLICLYNLIMRCRTNVNKSAKVDKGIV